MFSIFPVRTPNEQFHFNSFHQGFWTGAFMMDMVEEPHLAMEKLSPHWPWLKTGPPIPLSTSKTPQIWFFNKAHGPQSISNRAHIFICPNRNCQKLGGPCAHSPISAPEVKVLLRMLQSRRKQRNLLTSQGTTAPIGWRNHPSYNLYHSININ